jgi:hypothetical protein
MRPLSAAAIGFALVTAMNNVEQTAQGTRPAAALAASFDGLGVGLEGPQGTATLRNPSDNSLAVGPDHIVQTVNSRMAVFTKKGRRYDATGRVLFGPSTPTRSSRVWRPRWAARSSKASWKTTGSSCGSSTWIGGTRRRRS